MKGLQTLGISALMESANVKLTSIRERQQNEWMKRENVELFEDFAQNKLYKNKEI